MGILTPLQRVRGLGSAKSGTGEWWQQRLTSVALVPLSVLVVVVMVSLIGADHDTVVARIGHPVVAVALVLTLVSAAWHMQLGMRVIIEDYVHGAWKVASLIANAFFAVVVAVLGGFAVLTISLGA